MVLFINANCNAQYQYGSTPLFDLRTVVCILAAKLHVHPPPTIDYSYGDL